MLFSAEEVAAAEDLMDPNLGSASIDVAKELFAAGARACPACATPAAELRWISIGTSDAAWAAGDERCGWLTLCTRCTCQVELILDEEMTQLRREGNW